MLTICQLLIGTFAGRRTISFESDHDVHPMLVAFGTGICHEQRSGQKAASLAAHVSPARDLSRVGPERGGNTYEHRTPAIARQERTSHGDHIDNVANHAYPRRDNTDANARLECASSVRYLRLIFAT